MLLDENNSLDNLINQYKFKESDIQVGKQKF